MPIPAGSATPVAVDEYRPAAVSLDEMSVAIDEWTAGAVDTQGVEWRINKFEGWWGSPDLRLAVDDRPQDHGGFDGPSYLSPRVLTLEGLAISPSRAEQLLARDIVSSVCGDLSRLHTMVVAEPDRPTRQCQVRLSAATKIEDLSDTMCRWSMVLVAPDPRRYAVTETVLPPLTVPAAATGGLTFPATFGATFTGTGTSSAATTATNAGTFATRPTVQLNGPLTNPQIVNATAGRSLGLTIEILAGDYVELDFDKRTVLLNGTASRAYTIAVGSAWWELAPGHNEIQFTAGGGGGNAVVSYRSAWL